MHSAVGETSEHLSTHCLSIDLYLHGIRSPVGRLYDDLDAPLDELLHVRRIKGRTTFPHRLILATDRKHFGLEGGIQ